jgi:hypothetical protein
MATIQKNWTSEEVHSVVRRSWTKQVPDIASLLCMTVAQRECSIPENENSKMVERTSMMIMMM